MGAIRTLAPPAGEPENVYLTFDDGPAPGSTERVLDTLSRNGVTATFFVVAEKARREPALLKRIRAGGHSIGNHSLDHRYGAFFSGNRKMKTWISDSEKILSDLLGEPTVGFRPPAGVQTPELHRALRELRMPLVLWNIRFFDTVFTWTADRAIRSISQTSPGSIILLHDRQSPQKLPLFLEALSVYSAGIQKNGWVPAALSRDQLSRASNQETP